jgi:hypothetical protein
MMHGHTYLKLPRISVTATLLKKIFKDERGKKAVLIFQVFDVS